jgi:cation:H+ antiporter
MIPEAWFVGLHWSALIGCVLVALVILTKAADWLVEGASGLAYRLGLPKVIVGATIVALGTTTPEFAVSVMAAWGGNAGLALGNAVGSVIADTGLIFGLGCLLVALPADRYVLVRQGRLQFGSALLLIAICYGSFIVSGTDAFVGRGVGFLFIVMLFGYLYVSIRWSKKHPQGEPFQTPESVAEAAEGIGVVPEPKTTRASHSIAQLFGMVIVGLAIVFVSSHFLIHSVSELALQIGIPQVVIAATLVAFGTSLPELVVGMTSIRKGHAELLVGNVIGADILNILFVIGASAAVSPLPLMDPSAQLPEIFLLIHLPTMLIVLTLFRVFIVRAIRQGRFDRWMGIPLLILYVGYVFIQYVLSM